MGKYFGFNRISSIARARFVLLLCLIMILSSAGITQMVFAFPKLFDNGLNPIPYSPKKPDIPKISNYQIKKDDFLINVNGNTQLAKPFSKKMATTNINSRLNAFGSCVSLNVDNGVTTFIDNTFIEATKIIATIINTTAYLPSLVLGKMQNEFFIRIHPSLRQFPNEEI